MQRESRLPNDSTSKLHFVNNCRYRVKLHSRQSSSLQSPCPTLSLLLNYSSNVKLKYSKIHFSVASQEFYNVLTVFCSSLWCAWKAIRSHIWWNVLIKVDKLSGAWTRDIRDGTPFWSWRSHQLHVANFCLKNLIVCRPSTLPIIAYSRHIKQTHHILFNLRLASSFVA